jgi:hypothetical protein
VPFDLGQVDWLEVATLAAFVFVASLVANLLSFGHRVGAALLAAAPFAAIFVFSPLYLHGLPLPASVADQNSNSALVPRAPAAPQKPSNPVKDVTPTSR